MWRRRGRILLAAVVLLCGSQLGRSKPNSLRVSIPAEPAARSSVVWTVEENADRVLYSNGLSISRAYETESAGRHFRSYSRDLLKREAVATAPVGIVFHSTESEIFAFEPAQNRALLRGRESMLEHVRSGRSYNFVIDRFGQAYRIVPENQIAMHAGHSIWASAETVWIDLNESFLGVSFEAESRAPFEPSPAQIHTGRLLTEMLRFQYSIAEANCVTHAQVSVNPDNMRIGYHTDWGASFPFAAIGVNPGYGAAVAAVAVFGFGHDQEFLRSLGNRAWPGLLAAEDDLSRRAAREGITAQEFRIRLQQQYKTLRRQRNG